MNRPTRILSAFVQELTELRSLGLFTTQITDAGLKYLEGPPILQELTLGHTQARCGRRGIV
jgi:hypothetical protein